MIEIRRACSEDAILIALTRRTVWEETYRGIYPDEKLDSYDVQAYAQRDREKILDPSHHYYLFLDGKDCIGYFSFGPYNYGIYKDFSLCLNHLYIRSDYQGRGLGKQAFAILRDYCARQGITKFFCGCNAHNQQAQGFYRHMGGIAGDLPRYHVNKSDDIIHFEFHIGEHL